MGSSSFAMVEEPRQSHNTMVGLERAAPTFISVTIRLWRQYLITSVYNVHGIPPASVQGLVAGYKIHSQVAMQCQHHFVCSTAV